MSLIVGLIVFWKNKESLINKTYFLLAVSTSIWAIGILFHAISRDEQVCLFWARFAHIGASFIAIFYLHFILSFLGLIKQKKAIIKVGYGIAFVMSLLAFTPLFFTSVSPKMGLRLWADPGPLYPFFIVFFLTFILYGFLLALKRYALLSGYKRNQLRYIIIASLIGYTGGSSTFLAVYGMKIIFIHPFALYLVSFYNASIAYAIIKYRLMEITVAISRAGLILGIYSLVFGVPFYLGHQTGSWLLSTSLAVALAIPAPFIYRYFRVKAEDVLFAEQRHYQKILVQAAGGMVKEHRLDRLLKLIVYIVKKTVKLNFAAIFLHNREENVYNLKVMRDPGRMTEKITSPDQNALISYLKTAKEPVLYEELPRAARMGLGSSFPIGLIVPSIVENELLGFLVLGEKLNRKPYSDDDINVFKILSNQAALAIENCVFLEEFKHAQERIFTAEKLASIGGMADGVAHQIKNRLNHFSVASGELKYEISDFIKAHPSLVAKNSDLQKAFDYLIHIADSLIDNVTKTDNVIRGILNFARTEEKENFFSQFSFKEIIDISLELLKVKHQITEFPLEAEIDSTDAIYGVKSQIMEAIYNLLDNAYEAIQEKITHHLKGKEKEDFQPSIRVSLAHNRTVSFITVIDNGIGIKEDDKRKVFAPFFTTKSSYKSGTGIGMYVVRRMIEENHKGRVWFESKYMKGTRFSIELPRKIEKGWGGG
ncbi:MAG: GAF domain-containing protein [Candidatus Omnitrophota bacterium]|nr:MAG: GAF domain-containing protein [Candidatus Omnitrophota bacterium]